MILFSKVTLRMEKFCLDDYPKDTDGPKAIKFVDRRTSIRKISNDPRIAAEFQTVGQFSIGIAEYIEDQGFYKV